ncbi:unnamed protein product [Blepharisma stoltei]|uniref:Uncharacterized protein n=1 Tax=Blepharisma stoltei TaxID=1481888 RepID=A0AAU9JC37_9CILI|nr:unnamed protein product [Blepharisma stoltei]
MGEESQVDIMFKKLIENDSGKHVYVPSLDPVGLYNHAIKQFNAKINKTAEGSYERLDENCFYALWMKRWWNRLRADESIFFLIFSLLINVVVSLVPVLNIIVCAIWIIVWLIYERIAKRHKENSKLCENPFKYMIYAPEVCRRAKLINLYLDLPSRNLGSFGLKESQISVLQSRSFSGTVKFMVFNNTFKFAFTKFGFLRIFHVLQILASGGAITIANLVIYPMLGISELILI